METTLYYADDPDEIALIRKSEPLVFKYEKVSIRSYRLGNLINGIYKYMPVEFTYSLASILFTTVHCTLLNTSFCDHTVFDEPEECATLKESRTQEDIKNRSKWDELSFKAFSLKIGKNVTKKRSLVEHYLFSNES